MIAKEFEEFPLSHLEHCLIPAEDSATFIDTCDSGYAMFLLVNNGYSRVPITIKDKEYVGTINIANVMSYQTKNQLTDWELAQTDIGKMVNIRMEATSETSNLTDIIHLLVDYPFLPALDKSDQFLGIITHKSILKAVSSLLHDFTDYYTIAPKGD